MTARAQSYSIIFDAFVEPSDDTIDLGYAVTKNSAGTGYVVASTANLADSVTGVIDGITLEIGTPGKVMQVQRDAKVEARYLPYVGTGSIENAVVASDGRVRRASASAGTVVGVADHEGNVQINLAGSVASFTLAGDVTGPSGSNTVERILGATVAALSGNVGKALVLTGASAFGFAAFGTATSGYDTADHGGGGQEVLSATGSSGTFTIRDNVVTAVSPGVATGGVIKFGTTPATSGALRFPSYSSITSLLSYRNGTNASDRNAVAVQYSGGRDQVTIGQAETDVIVAGANAFVAMLGSISDATVIVSKSDFTAPMLMLGVVGVGSGAISVTTGTGAPASSANDGSVYFRNNGTDGTNGIYTRQGGAWYAVGGAGGSGVTWADDLSTSTDTHQYVSQITGSAGVCNVVSGTVLKFLGATTVASTGVMRFIKNQTIIASRNNGDSANLTVLATTSGDMIQVGGSGALGVSPTGFIEVGSNVATTGAARLANNSSIYFRNAANNGNVAGLAVDSSNNVIVGDSSRVGYFTGSTVIFQGTSAELARADTSGLLCPNNIRLGTAGGYRGLWADQASPSTSNYTIRGAGGDTWVNVTSSATGYFGEADVARAGWSAFGLWVQGGRNFSVGSANPTMNSATNTICLSDGTQPSAAPSAGVYMGSDSGRWHVRSSSTASGTAINMILDSVTTGPGGTLDPDHGIKIIVDKPGSPAQTRWLRFYST